MSAEEQIRGYLSFDDRDLFANRNGRFSEKQSKKFAELDRSTSRLLLVVAIVILVGAIWRSVVLFNTTESWTDWILPVILFSISIWLVWGTFNRVDTVVARAEGVVNFVKVVSKTGSVTDAEIDRTEVSSYEMHVGGVAFDNANPALIEYMQGDTYAIYYTNSTRQILSAERIAGGD